MTEVSVPPARYTGTRLGIGNALNRARPLAVFHEALAGSVYSGCRWYIEPSDTMLRSDVEGFVAPSAVHVGGSVNLYTAHSMLLQHQSNLRLFASGIASTVGESLSNEFRSPSPVEADEMLSALSHCVLVTNRAPVLFAPRTDRYFAPLTPVTERVSELILDEVGQEDVLLDRRLQAEWVQEVFSSHWGVHLPQPYMGFDLDDGLFVASWQSDTECNTLTIDASQRKGWYDPWPGEESDNPLPEEIDLETEEAWHLLRAALMGTR